MEYKYKFRVIPEWVIDRWMEVAYLVINGGGDGIAKVVEYKPDKEFYEVVNTNLHRYINEGELPPREITPAILNIADDYMAGRRLTLRAGDYISLQNYIRGNK
jgi:hypothetical protein